MTLRGRDGALRDDPVWLRRARFGHSEAPWAGGNAAPGLEVIRPASGHFQGEFPCLCLDIRSHEDCVRYGGVPDADFYRDGRIVHVDVRFVSLCSRPFM